MSPKEQTQISLQFFKMWFRTWLAGKPSRAMLEMWSAELGRIQHELKKAMQNS